MRWILLAAVTLIIGCGGDGIRVVNNPSIVATRYRNKSASADGIKISYKYHSSSIHNNCYTRLESIDDVKQYKKEVQSLLQRLNDFEEELEFAKSPQ